jgi:hypothetical protein
MANLLVKNGANADKYLKSTGAGTDGDPHVSDHSNLALQALIGEVQASPTSNTLLDRLKALLTGIVLAAGSNAIGKLAANSGVDIGDVDVTSLPALPAGTNSIGKLAANSGVDIGDVDVTSLPALPAGSNAIGKLAANSGVDIGDVDVTSLPALPAGTNAIGKLAANSGVDIGDVDVTSLPALASGENQIGSVTSPDSVITITASLDTNAYADGDTLFDTQAIANAARVNGGTVILQSITISDIDDQGKPFDLIFFNANTSLGTENSAPDIDDTEVLTVIGRVSIADTDYYDLGVNRIACKYGIGLLMKAGAATTSLYVAGISRGTPTYSASGLQIQFAFMRN